jgi:hypothetical protein
VSKKPDERGPNVESPTTQTSIIQPMIDELKGTQQKPKEDLKSPPRGPIHPPEPGKPEPAKPDPAEMDQDGSGEQNRDPSNPQT